ncbi:beta-galactosidase [Hydrogenophaga soli]
MVKKISTLPEKVKQRIVGISLLGEIHHMFPDFEKGMGEFDQPRVTDYSPASIAGFRQWLIQQHGSIQTLNKRMGTPFAKWDDVKAPGLEWPQGATPTWNLYGHQANGWLPITGWAWNPSQKPMRISIVLDDTQVANAQLGLNRLDVYRAIDEVKDPNVGFRYDLDVSTLSPGPHQLQVWLEIEGQQMLLGASTLNLANTAGKAEPLAPKAATPPPTILHRTAKCSSLVGSPRQNRPNHLQPIGQGLGSIPRPSSASVPATLHTGGAHSRPSQQMGVFPPNRAASELQLES